MGKFKELAMSEEVKEETPIPGPTHTALSMALLPEKGWAMVVLRFNPVTGGVAPLEFQYVGEAKDYIIERMKIDTVQRGIFNNSNQPY